MTVRLEHGDCLDVMRRLIDEGVQVDSICTDPPYHLTSIVKRFGKEGSAPAKSGKTGAYARSARGFMGKEWDGGDIAFRAEVWELALQLLKPGGHIAAFSGTRTYHRMACAIEDAGFEIRDQLAWVYGSGFPKSHDVSKAIDKHLGHEREKVRIPLAAVGNMKARQDTRPFMEAAMERGYHEAASPEAASPEAASWQGWGTAVKPAFEPVCLARKPMSEKTVAANVLRWGTGALNIDGCRVPSGDTIPRMSGNSIMAGTGEGWDRPWKSSEDGRARRQAAADLAIDKANELGRWPANIIHDGSSEATANMPDGAERYFYSAKADATDRLGSKHPTVKPTDLMAWLMRLITPPGGTVLDCFAGSGSTGMAAMREGFDCILIEREAEYIADIQRRLAHVRGEDSPLFGGAASPPPARAVPFTGSSRTNNRPGRNEEVNA